MYQKSKDQQIKQLVHRARRVIHIVGMALLIAALLAGLLPHPYLKGK